MFGRLFTGWTQPSPLVNFAVLLVIAVGIGSQYVPKTLPLRAQEVFSRLSVVARELCSPAFSCSSRRSGRRVSRRSSTSAFETGMILSKVARPT